MKGLFLLFFFIALNSHAKDSFFLELGLGVDYGGLGTQFHIPLNVEKIDVYLSTGLFYASSNTNEEIGFGAGVSYFVDKHNGLNVYYGTLNVDKYLTDNLEVVAEPDYGVSFGYKYFFKGKNKSGLTFGINYNIYEDDHYPFFSIGYRY